MASIFFVRKKINTNIVSLKKSNLEIYHKKNNTLFYHRCLILNQ